MGSGADFTAGSANPANTFSAGALSIDNSRADAAIFSPSNMKPGGAPQTGTVDIGNAGSLAGDFYLSRDQLVSTDAGQHASLPFATKVAITVVDCGAYAGSAAPSCGDAGDVTVTNRRPLSSLDETIEVGRFDPGERHRFSFAADLDASAGNEYAGDGASARFMWSATQTSGG